MKFDENMKLGSGLWCLLFPSLEAGHNFPYVQSHFSEVIEIMNVCLPENFKITFAKPGFLQNIWNDTCRFTIATPFPPRQ